MNQSRSTMSLTSPISCASNDFSFFCVVCFLFCCICCHRTNQIFLIMILMMMDLTLDPLVRTLFAIFLCVLTIPFVSTFGSDFFSPTGVESKGGIFVFVVFVPTVVESKVGRCIEIFWPLYSLFSFQI